MDLLLSWPSLLLGLLATAAACFAVGHAILTKEDVRAAIGWVGFILVFPVAGPAVYLVFGVNRLHRRARALRPSRRREREPRADGAAGPAGHLGALARAGERVVGLPLLGGNRVTPLRDGEEAYPPMLDAIEGAERTLALSTYIFDCDRTGRRFQDGLVAAVERGVQVRVLVDSVGARYSWPPPVRALRRRGVPAAGFMPTRVPWHLPFLNLRTHRKILVADGRRAFAGGINLRDEHLVEGGTKKPVHDLHFEIGGPVVRQLLEVFVADWQFTTGEELAGEEWFPTLDPVGETLARVVPDGPDEDLDKAYLTILAAIAAAERSVRILNPYFLPDRALVSALHVAALRGVDVVVALPQVNNIGLVGWATEAHLEQVLRHGLRVFFLPPPFDHSKLLVVDGEYALVGSANLDPRSLRLNFEVNVELFDAALGRRLAAIVDEKLAGGVEVTREELLARSLLTRLRDHAARLATPYL